MTVESSKTLIQKIHDALTKAKLFPETSERINGLMNAVGSTGFSVRVDPKGWDFHIVLDGKKCGLKYKKESKYYHGEHMDMHTPVDPKSLIPQIQTVFKKLKLKVIEARHTSSSEHWDYGVGYNILCKADESQLG